MVVLGHERASVWVGGGVFTLRTRAASGGAPRWSSNGGEWQNGVSMTWRFSSSRRPNAGGGGGKSATVAALLRNCGSVRG
jgi:hypothetical protein